MFDGNPDSFNRRHAVSVQYKDRVWEIELNSDHGVGRDTSSIAIDLQAALNLARPPVGLRLLVAPGTEAVVCPLSVLVACPSYIATTFQGMSWIPLMEGAGDDDVAGDDTSDLPPVPTDPLLPPPLGSPLERAMPSLTHCQSTASPSEGCGRPLTAPPGDRNRGMLRPRPTRREGLGRPMSATPSDKSFGMRRLRPGKSEGFGRPVTALPSDHSGSGSPAWGLHSPSGFRCEESAEDVRPATAPAFAAALRRRPSSNLAGSRGNPLRQFGSIPPQRSGEGGVVGGAEGGDEVAIELGGVASLTLEADSSTGNNSWEEGRAAGPARECWA